MSLLAELAQSIIDGEAEAAEKFVKKAPGDGLPPDAPGLPGTCGRR